MKCFVFAVMQSGITLNSEGAVTLCKALKTNTSLTKLGLISAYSRESKCFGIYKYCSFLLMSKTTENELDERGATSLSDALKSNSTLTKLDLEGEKKKETKHKRFLSAINFFPFSSNKQTTRLEKQVQKHYVMH